MVSVDLLDKKAIYFNVMQPGLKKRGGFWAKGNHTSDSIESFLDELESAYQDHEDTVTYHDSIIEDAEDWWEQSILSFPNSYSNSQCNEKSKHYVEVFLDRIKKSQADRQLFTIHPSPKHAFLVEMILREQTYPANVYDVKIYNAGFGSSNHLRVIEDRLAMTSEQEILFDELSKSRRPTLVFEKAQFDKKALTLFFKSVLSVGIRKVKKTKDGYIDDVMLKQPSLPLEDRQEKQKVLAGWYDIMSKIIRQNHGKIKFPVKDFWHKLQVGPMCTKKQTSLWMKENFPATLYRAVKLHQLKDAKSILKDIKEKELQQASQNQKALYITKKLRSLVSQKYEEREQKLEEEQEKDQSALGKIFQALKHFFAKCFSIILYPLKLLLRSFFM